MDLSKELYLLEAKYDRLQETQPVRTSEPENAGRSVVEFTELTKKVAESYTPSEYVKNAPLK